MLKGQKKHIDGEQGKTKHEALRSVNYRATQNENNIMKNVRTMLCFRKNKLLNIELVELTVQRN